MRRFLSAFVVTAFLLFGSPLFADPIADYQYCIIEGKKAFDRHDDAEASRYFDMARRVYPLGDKPYKYLRMIAERRYFPDSKASSDPLSLGFEDLMKEGQDALARGERKAALDFFYKALLINESDPRPLEYINLVKRLQEDQTAVVGRMKAMAGALDQYGESALPPGKDLGSGDAEPVSSANIPEEAVEDAEPAEQADLQGAASLASSERGTSSSEAEVSEQGGAIPPAAPVARGLIKKSDALVETLSLSEVMAGGTRPTILLEFGGAVVLEGVKIQRFLVMDPSVVEVKTLSPNQIQIKALKRSSTFVHIWDETGRSTIYVEVILPQPSDEELVQFAAQTEHARPFRILYSNDWSSYYYGPDTSNLERRTLTVQQRVGVDGETPYGDFDASGSFSGYGATMSSMSYTMGLSSIPAPGVSNFNLRLYDARRYVSPLTLPGVRLRGGFADAYLFRDMIGVSLTHGRLLPAFGYLFSGFGSSNRHYKVYADAARVTLFPTNKDHQVSLNYAQSYGPDREEYLTKKVYSVEGKTKISQVSLSGELARDQGQESTLAGVQWADGRIRTGVNFRDINKDFTTVTNTPSGQGEIGAVLTADADWDRLGVNSSVDIFQDRLSPNPDDPDALNYDGSLRVRVPVTDSVSFDTGARYMDTPGQVSPHRFSSADARLSQRIALWSGRQATVYAGTVYQKSRYAHSPTSEYDRCAVFSGAQLPLTKNLVCYANYEYSWLHEPETGLDAHPNVFNAGLNYSRELTRRLSGNLGVAYRNEEDIRGLNSFLAGEDSVMLSSGLSFMPMTDVNVFLDGRLRNVWAQIPDNPSYNDMDVRMGMRMALGTAFSWDPKGGVSGFVFKDKNGDGKFKVGEDEGIPGIKVKVGDQEVETDERGWYRAQVHSKKAVAAPLMESIPAGFVFSTPASSTVNIFQGVSKRVDFGLTTQSGLYGVVFVDKNGSGAPDKEDQFVGRVIFTLDGTVKQISDSRGAYFFKNIAPGKHVVTVDMRSIPMEFVPQVKMKSDVVVSEGTTYIFHVPLKIKPSASDEASKPPVKEQQ